MEKICKYRGAGRVALQKVANSAGVGTMIASCALRTPEQVSDELRKEIEQVVEELGYIPNRTVSTLASGYSHIVIVLVPPLIDKASSCFMQLLQQVLNKNEFQLLLGCHGYNQLKEAEILMTLLQGNPTVSATSGSQLADKTHQILEKTDTPAIDTVGSPFSPTQITIEIASFETSHKLTEHLLEQGYKNIGFIGAHMENHLQRQQLNGWHKTMLSHYQNTGLVIAIPGAASLQLGRYTLNEILLRQPELDAVICSREEIAPSIMSECQWRLLKIPGNIAVACLDDSDSHDQTYPTLTSIHIDYKKMGIETGELLVGLLNNSHDESGESRIVQSNYQIESRQSI